MKTQRILFIIGAVALYASGFILGASGLSTRLLASAPESEVPVITEKDLKVEYYLEMCEDSVIIQNDLGTTYKCHLDDVVKTLVDDNQ
jgi:hypothetical protein